MQWKYLQAEHVTYHVTYCVTKLLGIQLNKIVHPTAYMELVVDPGNDKIGWQNCFGPIFCFLIAQPLG